MMDVRKMASMGQRAMRKQQSKAEKIFWPMQAGRSRQFKPGLLEAVHLGRGVANRLSEAVVEAGLNPSDAGSVLVCATSEGKLADKLFFFSADNQDVNDLKMARDILNGGLEPIGIAFMLLDREKGNLLGHGKLFETNERNERLLDALLAKWEFDFTTGAGRFKAN